jgi:hypothetical protein
MYMEKITIPEVGTFKIEGLSHSLQVARNLIRLSRELHLDFNDLRSAFLKERGPDYLSPQHLRILQAARSELEKVQSEIHYEVYKEILKAIDSCDE